ncbi:Plasma membrane ATPase proteolipid 2 [Cichlidogyrus casuarinus]|uniref:Plasma membrane ATPase proteolipid 2 n=1 Tax=Cichlidogyrus casuarinus TaxID=1844966 RepID=A0ABD2PSB8_9PLAT
MTLDSKWIGSWKLTGSEQFDELMQAYGVSLITRKAACAVSPVLTISEEADGKYQMKSETTLKKSNFTFKLDEEFDEKTPDDATVKSTIKKETEDKLIQVQKATDKRPETKITREIVGNTLTATYEAGNVVCKRIYTKQ